MSPQILASIILAVTCLVIVAVIVVSTLINQRGRLRRAVKLLEMRVHDLDAELAQARKSESDAADTAARYCLLFNNAMDMVFLYGIDGEGMPGHFFEVNDAACSQLGYSREELHAMTSLDVEVFEKPASILGYSSSDMATLSDEYVHGREKKLATRAARRLVETVLKEGHLRYESAFRRSDGSTISVEIFAQHFKSVERPMIMCTAKGIDDRIAAEKALQESKQLFMDFFRQTPIGIAVYDAYRRLSDVNPACMRIFGVPDRAQFERLNLLDNPFIPAEARGKLSKGEGVRYEAVVDFQEVLDKTMFATSRTGLAYFDVLITNIGFDADYRARGYFAQVQDITDRRRAEESLRQSEQQLRQAEKMEALGSMAGGIAHDFNNILTPIIGYSQMMIKKYSDGTGPLEQAQRILKAANRAKDLVGQILSFSRKSESKDSLHPVHIIPIAKEVLKMHSSSLPPGIEINRVIKAEQDKVLANPTKIHQVLMNLCTNAVYAMKKTGGILEMRITNFVVARRSGQEFAELEPGQYLRISIKDTGTGMDQATIKRIFEPFFTTKPCGEGTGMGLAVVHGILKSIKGGISVESEVGKGSVFHVALPIVAEQAVEEVTNENTSLPTGTENILIVDDNAEAAELTTDMLKSLGYVTTVARSAIEALDLFKLDPGRFRLVLTDQVMPGMTGLEMAKILLRVRPDIAMVLYTGFSEAITAEQARALGVREFLLKPVSMDDLANAVRRALDFSPAGS
jgi:signal transduction histidine kinase/ActR/RegA family two-component response regulator